MSPALPPVPPIRDTVSTVDPRAITLALANRKAKRWVGQRPGSRKQGAIPRALRAKGYEPVATLIGAWTGTPIDTGTVRSWWRFDMNRGASDYLPPPDAIIKRKGGTLLPGWADETIREWLSGQNFFNPDTYREWDETHDEIDPAIVALLEGNEAHNVDVVRHRVQRIRDNDRDVSLPASYVALGYDFAAQVISDAQGSHIADNTVCKYWREDLNRRDIDSPNEYIDPYSLRMPMPDAIIARGPRDDLMPGWTEATLRDWVPTRPGPGNRTSGEFRRGYAGSPDMERVRRARAIETVGA